jgi:hypothetical protein
LSQSLPRNANIRELVFLKRKYAGQIAIATSASPSRNKRLYVRGCKIQPTQGENKMNENEFNQLCQSHLIDPSIALENENIIEALQVRGCSKEDVAEKVEQVLRDHF